MDYLSVATTGHYFLIFFRLIGFWWDKTSSVLYKCYSYLFLFSFFVIYTTLKCFYLKDLQNISEATFFSFVCLTEIVLVLKIINFLWRNDYVRNGQLDLNAFALKKDDEHKLVSKNMRFLRKMYISYAVLTNITAVLSFLFPLTSKDPVLPFLGWYPLDWRHNRLKYWIVYGYQVMGMVIQCNTLVSLEMYVVYLMIVVGTYLKILSLRMAHIGGVEDKWDSSFEARALIENIKTHKFIIRCAKDIEDNFSLTYFIQIIVSGAVLCFTLFQIAIMNVSEAITQFLFYFAFIAVMLTQIFLPSYFGSEISLAASNLRMAIYHSNWIVASTAHKKNIVMIMERTKLPTVLKAANLIPISRESFGSLLNRSYSLYAVLQKSIKN